MNRTPVDSGCRTCRLRRSPPRSGPTDDDENIGRDHPAGKTPMGELKLRKWSCLDLARIGRIASNFWWRGGLVRDAQHREGCFMRRCDGVRTLGNDLGAVLAAF